jgi:DNA-directed RNA polymerase III subunit RPC7
MAARGGRGGGRGGRGGARGGKSNGLPWDFDPSSLIDKPQETYPKTYHPPLASRYPLSFSERRSVSYFVRFRRDFHNDPLYTHRHMAPDSVGASSDFGHPVAKAYGQEQLNDRYGVKSKANIDPFLAVPMYTHQFVSETRTVPDIRGRSFNHDLFPEELWVVLDGKDGTYSNIGGGKKGTKRKSMAAGGAGDDTFEEDDEFGRRKRPETDEERRRRIAEAATGKENEDDAADEELDEEEGDASQEDDDFEDDEDGGDYDAEQYFDGGEDDFEDDGVGESAVDF